MMFVLTLLFAAIACASSGQVETRFLRKPLGSSRIIHGSDAEPYEFPHQASLLDITIDPVTSEERGSHRCGASVIAENWVLTAGHCVVGMTTSNLAVVVDLHDLFNPGNYIWFYIDQIILHENYGQGPGGYPNDVALLRLQPNGWDITKNIIKIAEGNDNYAGQTCTITGWGATVDASLSYVLQKADVTVLAESHCKNYWGSSILPQHVCVKSYDTENGRGACNGDSGGPLVCLDEGGMYELVGVTSWGLYECHSDGVVTHPSVYVRVTDFNKWINDNCGNCASNS